MKSNLAHPGLVSSKLKIIGWREWIGLPELGIEAIKVKVDSGARTSALHATRIRYLVKKSGETWVSFMVGTDCPEEQMLRVRAPLIEKRKVKSSLGHSSIRPVIQTLMRIGDESWPIEITLVNRDPMGFRMLLGRRALRRRYMIHPARSFIQSKPRADL
jgi:hypothetical protein